jgi:hypothetical protein
LEDPPGTFRMEIKFPEEEKEMQQILIFLMFVAVFGLIAGMLLLTLALLSPKNAKPVIPITTCAIILTGSIVLATLCVSLLMMISG